MNLNKVYLIIMGLIIMPFMPTGAQNNIKNRYEEMSSNITVDQKRNLDRIDNLGPRKEKVDKIRNMSVGAKISNSNDLRNISASKKSIGGAPINKGKGYLGNSSVSNRSTSNNQRSIDKNIASNKGDIEGAKRDLERADRINKSMQKLIDAGNNYKSMDIDDIVSSSRGGVYGNKTDGFESAASKPLGVSVNLLAGIKSDSIMIALETDSIDEYEELMFKYYDRLMEDDPTLTDEQIEELLVYLEKVI